MKDKKRIEFTNEQLILIYKYVSVHAHNVESQERWNQDRDESYEWRSISNTIGHLAHCPYRKQVTGDYPVGVLLFNEDWKRIKDYLSGERKKNRKVYLNGMYILQIKKVKAQIKAVKTNKGIDPNLITDIPKLEANIADMQIIINANKERQVKTVEELSSLLKLIGSGKAGK